MSTSPAFSNILWLSQSDRLINFLATYPMVTLFFFWLRNNTAKSSWSCVLQIVIKPTATHLPVLGETSLNWMTLQSSSYHILISVSKPSIKTACARRVVVNADTVWGVSSIQSAGALKNSVFWSLITAFLSMFGENLYWEFEIVHQVLKNSKKLAISLQFGK